MRTSNSYKIPAGLKCRLFGADIMLAGTEESIPAFYQQFKGFFGNFYKEFDLIAFFYRKTSFERALRLC